MIIGFELGTISNSDVTYLLKLSRLRLAQLMDRTFKLICGEGIEWDINFLFQSVVVTSDVGTILDNKNNCYKDRSSEDCYRNFLNSSSTTTVKSL